MESKEIIILGGGAAGWLTALFCISKLNSHNITLIESKTIGILGAGEGTTPHMVDFLKLLEIDINDLIKKTKGTIKNGISFENWNGNNKKYFHPFGVFNEADPFSMPDIFSHECYDFYLKALINKKLDFKEYDYPTKISYENKVDFINVGYALHIDAHEFANYLKNVAIERGVKHIEGDCKELKTDKYNFIKHIALKNNKTYKCDFVFDCTGFGRVIIGSHYKERWISYENHLPMKKAIPFILKQEQDIKPYTQALAMKHGWMWKIPLQNWIGAGYVFDSDYISNEQAVDEANQFLNQKIKPIKVIDFKAGRYENTWINNCMAVGLSSNFTEPLEATSLFLTVEQLNLVSQYIPYMFKHNQKALDQFNTIVGDSSDAIMHFLYMHYLTKRKDSKFWKEFKEKNKCPETFKNILEYIKEGILMYPLFRKDGKTASFVLRSHLYIASGLELIKNKIELEGLDYLEPSLKEYRKTLRTLRNTEHRAVYK